MSKIKDADMDRFMEDNNDLMEDLANQEEMDKLRQSIKDMQVEIDEQCRLNGMGGSRELKLIIENNELKSKIANIWAIHNDFLNGSYTKIQKENHELKSKNSELFNANIRNLQSLGNAVDVGSYEVLLKERDRLKEENHKLSVSVCKGRLLIIEIEKERDALKGENANMRLDLEWPLVKERDQALNKVRALNDLLYELRGKMPSYQDTVNGVCLRTWIDIKLAELDAAKGKS